MTTVQKIDFLKSCLRDVIGVIPLDQRKHVTDELTALEQLITDYQQSLNAIDQIRNIARRAVVNL